MKKYSYLFILQTFTGYGWEDLTASESRNEVRDDLKAYRENSPAPYRIIQRRELNG